MHTLKPFDSMCVLKAAEETGAVYTVEEHTIFSGLGSIVADVLAKIDRKQGLRRLVLKDVLQKDMVHQVK